MKHSIFLVAALATALWVPHASPDGKTWGIVRIALGRSQMVFAMSGNENAELFDAGACVFDIQRVVASFNTVPSEKKEVSCST